MKPTLIGGDSAFSATTGSKLARRRFLATTAAAMGGMVVARWGAAADRDWSGAHPIRYPDPDILSLDPRFNRYRLGNTPIQRLYTGTMWAEGCAWNGVGRYLLWSDIPSNVQMRWLDENSQVSVFRRPSGNSNGNTFDYQGRQLSCEHGNRRVVRYEHDGSVTVLADQWGGRRLNAPNDIVVHPDGGIWFTDPGYGSMMNYEGNKGPLEIPEATYRIDPKSGRMEVVSDDLHKPNGICFSADYQKLYIADTGGPNPKGIQMFDVMDGVKLQNRRLFCSMELEGRQGGADGIRCDIDGNVWAAAGWAGPGYDGVHVFAPDGQRIGLIRLPEICGNLCFGGIKRNRLFMAASQSLYAVYVETQGAHIT